MPLFAPVSAQRSVSRDRASRAAARSEPGRSAPREASQTGRSPGAACPPLARDGATVRWLAIHPAPDAVSSSGAHPTAPAPANPGSLAHLAAGGGHAALGALYRRRPPLERPLHVGVPQPRHRASPRGSPLCPVHIPSRVSAPMDAALTRDAADATSPLAPRGGTPER